VFHPVAHLSNTLQEFNLLHPNIQYTIEKQINNTLNFLDITIKNVHNKLTFDIYRKPTTTDIIHKNSCHPAKHKNTAILHLINRMNTYPITKNNKQLELQRINTILQNNNYPPHVDINTKEKHNKNTPPNTTQKKKWTIFTYVGTETRTITRLFTHTNLRIAFKTNNTIQNHLQPKKTNPDKYNNSGIYQMKCKDCHKKYIGQTGRKFKTRYKEHMYIL
jgi:hypothetical protein